MKILITGINGFIGHHLSKTLIERGHEVIGSGDVLNKKLIEKEVSGAECVIHLAAKTAHSDIVENKFEALEVNLMGTKNVLDAYVKSKRAKKFIYPSTGKVYGNIIKLPIKEENPTNPLNLLGKSKLIAERLIDFYSNNQKEFIILRIFNAYGPGQRKDFLISTIISQIEEEKKKITLGDIKSKRDFVYINDVIDAFVCAIEKKGLRGLSIYNISTGESSNAEEIVSLIEKIKGKKIKIKSSPSLVRNDEIKNEYGSFDLARKELGWKPKVSIEQGLKKILLS